MKEGGCDGWVGRTAEQAGNMQLQLSRARQRLGAGPGPSQPQCIHPSHPHPPTSTHNAPAPARPRHHQVLCVLGVCLHLHRVLAAGRLHAEAPDLGAVVGTNLLLLRIEAHALRGEGAGGGFEGRGQKQCANLQRAAETCHSVVLSQYHPPGLSHPLSTSTHLCDEVVAAQAPDVEGHFKADDQHPLALELASAVAQRAMGVVELQQKRRAGGGEGCQGGAPWSNATVSRTGSPAQPQGCHAALLHSPC